MTTVYFVRHGQSLANAGGVTMAHHEIPLTQTGRSQASALAALLPSAAPYVCVSPFERALHTAAPYCNRYEIKANTMAELREFETIDPDMLAGMTGKERGPIADAYWAQAEVGKRMGKHAETFAEFARRVADFRRQHLDSLPDGTIVFGHGMWLGLLIWGLLGFTAKDSQGMKNFRRFQLGLPMPNGAVYKLHQVAPSKWTVQADEAVMRHMVGLV